MFDGMFDGMVNGMFDGMFQKMFDGMLDDLCYENGDGTFDKGKCVFDMLDGTLGNIVNEMWSIRSTVRRQQSIERSKRCSVECSMECFMEGSMFEAKERLGGVGSNP